MNYYGVIQINKHLTATHTPIKMQFFRNDEGKVDHNADTIIFKYIIYAYHRTYEIIL